MFPFYRIILTQVVILYTIIVKPAGGGGGGCEAWGGDLIVFVGPGGGPFD